MIRIKENKFRSKETIHTAIHSTIESCRWDNRLNCHAMLDTVLKVYKKDINTQNEKGNILTKKCNLLNKNWKILVNNTDGQYLSISIFSDYNHLCLILSYIQGETPLVLAGRDNLIFQKVLESGGDMNIATYEGVFTMRRYSSQLSQPVCSGRFNQNIS